MKNKTKQWFKKLQKFRKNSNSNRNIFVVCIAIIMIWRGIWNILDIYFFPNHPFINNMICIIIGIVILLVDDGKLGELGGDDPHRENVVGKRKD